MRGSRFRSNANPEYEVSGRVVGVSDTDDICTRPVHLVLIQDVVYLEGEMILP
jgi:hypothetical protein